MDMEESEDVRAEGLWKDGRINGLGVVGLGNFWRQRTGGVERESVDRRWVDGKWKPEKGKL